MKIGGCIHDSFIFGQVAVIENKIEASLHNLYSLKEDASMNRMTESEEFFKAAEAMMMDAVILIWDMAMGDEIQDLDQRLRAEGGKFIRSIMGLALSERGRKERHGREIPCSCGGAATFHQYRSYRISTVLPGKTVEAEAAYYVCTSCHRGVVPLLREICADEDGMTLGLQELLVLAGTIEPYEEASSNLLAKFAGVFVCGSKVQMKTVEEGEAAGEYLLETCSEIPAIGEERPADEALIVAIDGGMIHVDDRWQEVKLGVICNESDRVEISDGRSALMNREVVAVRGDPEQLAKLMEPRLACYKPEKRTAVVLGDGAKWIWNMAEDLFPNRVEILDFYHAVEHLSLCADVLFGENSPEGASWLDEQRQRLLENKAYVVIDALSFLKARFKSKTKHKAILSLMGYLAGNEHRMSYKTCLECGYPIGSGLVESAVKHVVQCRMKRPGTHWRRCDACLKSPLQKQRSMGCILA